jgi:hypothetical protein
MVVSEVVGVVTSSWWRTQLLVNYWSPESCIYYYYVWGVGRPGPQDEVQWCSQEWVAGAGEYLAGYEVSAGRHAGLPSASQSQEQREEMTGEEGNLSQVPAR